MHFLADGWITRAHLSLVSVNATKMSIWIKTVKILIWKTNSTAYSVSFIKKYKAQNRFIKYTL